VQLIIDRRYELLNASMVVRLGHWLRLLPEKEVEQNPLLICTQAHISIMLGNFADLKFFTEKAVEMMAALSPASDIYSLLKGEVLVLQGLVIMLGGDAPRSLAHADESMGYLSEDALLIRSLGIGVSSACHQMMGNCDHARALLREAMSNRMWPTNIQARLYYYLSIVSYLDGDLTGAMNASRECLRCLKDTPFAHTRAFANYFLGVGHYLRNERDAVEPFLMAVWADRHACNPSYVVQASLILACMYLSQGNEFAAVQMLNQILVYCREFDQEAISAIIQPVEAEIALRRGDLQRVQQACKQADFDVYVLPWLYYLPKLTPIKLMLAESTEQSLRKAHGRLSALDDQMRRINRKSVLIEILALRAMVCRKLKDEAAALQNLRNALDLAEPGNWIRTFVDLGMEMMDVLNCLIQQQTGQTYAQQVLKACQAENRKKVSMTLDETSKAQIPESPPNTVLTRREIVILPLLAEGLSNREIAVRLRIAPVTVKTHLQNIYKKLNTKNRIEALKRSRELGITIDK
jgi:LuxR family maltose regulon positive regulatory protein